VDLGHGVDLALRRAPEDLGEQVGLRGEVAVDAAGGDPALSATAATDAAR
jgi:hypothetical protein